jgi:hypothetical protein
MQLWSSSRRIRLLLVSWFFSTASAKQAGSSRAKAYEDKVFMKDFNEDVQRIRREIEQEVYTSFSQMKKEFQLKQQLKKRLGKRSIYEHSREQHFGLENEAVQGDYDAANAYEVSVDEQAALEGIDPHDPKVEERVDLCGMRDIVGGDGMEEAGLNPQRTGHAISSDEEDSWQTRAKTMSGLIQSKIIPKTKSTGKQKSQQSKKSRKKLPETSLCDQLALPDHDAKDAIQDVLHDDNEITDKEWWGALRTGIALLVLLVIMTYFMKMVEVKGGAL